MGTDNFGRDVFSRVLVGTREVFFLGGAGTLFAAIIGTSLGLLAGYVGRLWDEAIMRVLDVLLAFPALLLAMVLLATVGPSNLNLILVITVLYIPMFARIARSMVLDLRTREFVEAARLRGESRRYILFREMLPNAVPPLLVEASIRFAYSIFLVASLGIPGAGSAAAFTRLGTAGERSPHLLRRGSLDAPLPGSGHLAAGDRDQPHGRRAPPRVQSSGLRPGGE